jgi:hypothetical protein
MEEHRDEMKSSILEPNKTGIHQGAKACAKLL